jgi:hypothetical protein
MKPADDPLLEFTTELEGNGCTESAPMRSLEEADGTKEPPKASDVATESGVDDGTEEGAAEDGCVEFKPFPKMPPWAPVAVILADASASVSQVMLVPCLLTNGRAKQDVPATHWVKAHVPPTH